LLPLLLLAAAPCACSDAPAPDAARAGPAASSERPNVIFITVDTLRADRLGVYGSLTTRTPNLDAFADRSVRFERAYATLPKTNPALASLMTGRYPSAHGVRRNGTRLREAELTLAEILQAAGYTTAAFISNHVMVSRCGLAQGFMLYDETLPDAIPSRDARERTGRPLVNAVLAWAESPPRDPLFLWVHFIDPHGPYVPPVYPRRDVPAAAPGRTLPVSESNSPVEAIPAYQALPGVTGVGEYVDRYDAEVDYVDEQAGRLLEGLRSLGLLEGALVVVAADHGESLGDHGLYFQHGTSLHEAQIRIPLMILIPGVAPRVVEEPVSAVDVMPTVLERIGLPQPRGVQGTSLRTLIQPGGAAAHGPESPGAEARLVFSELGRKRAVLGGALKLIWDAEEKEVDLYDLDADLAEEHDVAASRPDEGRRLLGSLVRFARANTRDEAAATDEETLRVLKSLGYVE